MLGPGVVTRSSKSKKYCLNREKALSKKMAKIFSADDVNIQKKDGGKCIVIDFGNTIRYEQSKNVIRLRYAEVIVERREDDGANVEDVFKLPGLSVHLYHTQNKIMAQGKPDIVSGWVDNELCNILNYSIKTDIAVNMPLPMSPPLPLSPPRELELPKPTSPPLLLSASNRIMTCVDEKSSSMDYIANSPVNTYQITESSDSILLNRDSIMLNSNNSLHQALTLETNLKSFILDEITRVKKTMKTEKLLANSQLEQIRVENAQLRDEIKRLSGEIHSYKEKQLNLMKRVFTLENNTESFKKEPILKEPLVKTSSRSTCEDKNKLINDTIITASGLEEAPLPIPVQITQRGDRMCSVKPPEHPNTLKRQCAESVSTQCSISTVNTLYEPVVKSRTHCVNKSDTSHRICAPYKSETTQRIAAPYKSDTTQRIAAHYKSGTTQNIAAPYTNQTRKHLILGDSTLKGLHPDIMAKDLYEQVSLIALPGANFQKIRDVISSRSRDTNFTTITIHCGVIDSVSNVRLSESCMLEIVGCIRRKFPNAMIRFSSIVPPCRGQGRYLAGINNQFLQSFCKNRNYCFINNTPFFNAKSGAPKQRLYSDNIHLTKIGSSILAKNIKHPMRAVNLRDEDDVHLLKVDRSMADLVYNSSDEVIPPSNSLGQLTRHTDDFLHQDLHHLMSFSPLMLHQALLLSLKRLPVDLGVAN